METIEQKVTDGGVGLRGGVKMEVEELVRQGDPGGGFFSSPG